MKQARYAAFAFAWVALLQVTRARAVDATPAPGAQSEPAPAPAEAPVAAAPAPSPPADAASPNAASQTPQQPGSVVSQTLEPTGPLAPSAGAGTPAPRSLRAPSAISPLAQPAPADVVEAGADETDDGSFGAHQLHFYADAGVRTTAISNAGFDPFSSNDALVQFSTSFGRVLIASGPLSVGLAAGWDYGAVSASARGAATSLDAHRLTLIPELRYHLARRLYAFAKAGAGLAFEHASLMDVVSGAERTSNHAPFTFDAELGVALEVIGAPSGTNPKPRLWVVLDGGYLFTASSTLRFANGNGLPARSEPISLGELALSGPSGRVALALTF